jgi:hypothetical protein
MLRLKKWLACLMAAGFALFAVSTAAHAQVEITLSNSTQYVSFQAQGTNSTMEVYLGASSATGTCASCTLSGPAFFDGTDTGTYSFTTSGALTATWNNKGTGVFALSGTSNFSYSGADGDTLSGLVTWLTVNNGSDQPHLVGILNYTASGDSAFTAIFGKSGFAHIDFITQPMSCVGTGPADPCTLESIFAAGTGASGGAIVSSGQVYVPEPSAMILFGTGLLGMAGVIRLRKSARCNFGN